MSEAKIESVRAFEILDSRGRPTVEAHVGFTGGGVAVAQAPSGASTGITEAHELRDGDAGRHAGLGTLKAVDHIDTEIRDALVGVEIASQAEIDRRLIELDGTPNKSRLGANAILAVSCAVARAIAQLEGRPLWQSLAGERTAILPLPMVNILSGGLHAAKAMEFQDFLAIPHAAGSFRQAMEWITAIHREARKVLEARGAYFTGVADEGGWGPKLSTNEAALEVMVRAIEGAGLRPGADVTIALDVAASHFYQGGEYVLESERRRLNAAAFVELLESFVAKYPVVSIEDGLDQGAWEQWPLLTSRLGARAQIIGDDFLTTNPKRVAEAVEKRAANAVLVKMNQIGTITETFEVIDLVRDAGWRAVVSARSGETEDAFLADLAIASGMAQLKVGSITRSERLAKYNRLLVLEQTSAIPHWSTTPERLPTSAG